MIAERFKDWTPRAAPLGETGGPREPLGIGKAIMRGLKWLALSALGLFLILPLIGWLAS